MIVFTVLFWFIIGCVVVNLFNIILGGLIGSGLMEKIGRNLWFFVFLIVLFAALK